MRGVSELARMTPAYVEERYGVPPARYPELAALVGETSDNLPGVPGVGQGYAAKWLNQYDGLDNVITHADEITGKKGEALREHLADVIRNRRLNALVSDLELEARARRPGLAVLGPAGGARRSSTGSSSRCCAPGCSRRSRPRRRRRSTTRASTSRCGCSTTGELAGWLADHASELASRVGIHPVGHWAAGTGDLLALAFATEEGAAYVTTDKLDVDDEEALAGWLKDASKPKVLHDAKGPMLAFAARGMPLAGLERDTALSAYLARPDQRSYDLADLTVRYLKRELRQGPADDGQLSLEGLDVTRERCPAPARPRCCTPARCSTWRRRSTTSSRSAAAPGCSPRSSCRWSTCWPRWSGPASPSTATTSGPWRTTSPPR